jgi:hypothetical protein
MSFPLYELKDIHTGPLPADTIFSAGNLMLAISLLLALAYATYRLKPLWQAYWQLRQILRQEQALVPALNQWLKSTALRLWPRQDIAMLHGDAWLTFLDEQAAGHFRQFATDWNAWLYDEQTPPESARMALLRECRRWLIRLIRRRLC